MKTYKTCFIVAFIAVVGTLSAQDDRPAFDDYLKSKQQGFNQYQQQKEDDFNTFCQQANAQFAAKMAEAWKQFGIEPPVEVPVEPDPIMPMVRDKEPLLCCEITNRGSAASDYSIYHIGFRVVLDP